MRQETDLIDGAVQRWTDPEGEYRARGAHHLPLPGADWPGLQIFPGPEAMKRVLRIETALPGGGEKR